MPAALFGLIVKKITALLVQKRNRNRVNVFLDGEFAFGLAAIEAARLHLGQTLSDEEIARLRERDALETAHERALHFLSFRPRSESEVRRYLEGKGSSPEHVEEVMARLAGVGLVDDAAFARFWVENRAAFRPRGARALRYELRYKGLSTEAIDDALAEHDDEALALEAARSQARRLRAAPQLEFQRRLGQFLARRGFNYDIITEVVERIWREQEAERDLSQESEEG
jgi:regulatory protein